MKTNNVSVLYNSFKNHKLKLKGKLVLSSKFQILWQKFVDTIKCHKTVFNVHHGYKLYFPTLKNKF